MEENLSKFDDRWDALTIKHELVIFELLAYRGCCIGNSYVELAPQPNISLTQWF